MTPAERAKQIIDETIQKNGLHIAPTQQTAAMYVEKLRNAITVIVQDKVEAENKVVEFKAKLEQQDVAIKAGMLTGNKLTPDAEEYLTMIGDLNEGLAPRDQSLPKYTFILLKILCQKITQKSDMELIMGINESEEGNEKKEGAVKRRNS